MSPFPSAVQIGLLRPPARGGALSPNNESIDVEIKVGGEIPWFRVWGEIEHPQIWFRVGIDRLVRRSDECDLFAVGTKSQRASARPDWVLRSIVCDLCWFAAR